METVRRAAAAGETKEGTKVLFMPLVGQVTVNGLASDHPALRALGIAGAAAMAIIIFLEWRAWHVRNAALDRPSTMEMIQDRAVVWPVTCLLLLLAPANMAVRAVRSMRVGKPAAPTLRGRAAEEARRVMMRNILIAWLNAAEVVMEAA